MKPSEETPLCALALCQIAKEAGIPDGVLNCLTVAREEVIEVGKSLCKSHQIKKVSFTGSTAVGKWLLRESADTVKKVSMELGGSAPFIVFDDADIEVAVNALIASKFRNAGQVCIASNRILVQRKVYDEFAAAFSKRVNALVCGDGTHRDTNVGPLINQNQLNKVTKHFDDCVAKGATVSAGGSHAHPQNKTGGTFFYPTVLTNVTKDMLPFQEETFG
jgi:acyl-CoA reductase-like NAD-dependent aldehyde dehydrogenase